MKTLRTLNGKCHTYATRENAERALLKAADLIPDNALCMVAVVKAVQNAPRKRFAPIAGDRFAPVVVTTDLTTAFALAQRGITVCN